MVISFLGGGKKAAQRAAILRLDGVGAGYFGAIENVLNGFSGGADFCGTEVQKSRETLLYRGIAEI